MLFFLESGGRSFLRSVSRSGDIREMQLDKCNFEIEEDGMFDPEHPPMSLHLDLDIEAFFGGSGGALRVPPLGGGPLALLGALGGGPLGALGGGPRGVPRLPPPLPPPPLPNIGSGVIFHDFHN